MMIISDATTWSITYSRQLELSITLRDNISSTGTTISSTGTTHDDRCVTIQTFLQYFPQVPIIHI